MRADIDQGLIQAQGLIWIIGLIRGMRADI